MASLYGFAFAQDNRMPLLPRDGGEYSTAAVKSAVCSAEAMYWDSDLRDSVHLAWTGVDKPRYRALFDPSNEWSLDEYITYYLDNRTEIDPSRKALYYTGQVDPWYRRTPMEGLPSYTRNQAVIIKGLPYVESKYNSYFIYPNGCVLYTTNMGQGYVEGYRTLGEIFWDAEEDIVYLNVYLCDKTANERMMGDEDDLEANRLWCKPLSTSAEFFHSLYYTRLVYGSISDEEFSIIGGHNRKGRRVSLVDGLTQSLDRMLRQIDNAPALLKENVVLKGKFQTALRVPEGKKRSEVVPFTSSIWAWGPAGGYGLAPRVEVTVYKAQGAECTVSEKVMSMSLRSKPEPEMENVIQNDS